MKNPLIITSGKLFSKAIQTANLGNGSTWPGHIALKINPKFINETLRSSQLQTILIVGTNGKTTTTSLLRHILEQTQHKVIQNSSGANLLNGIASTLLINASTTGKVSGDYALFETDENAFPQVCKELQPDIIVFLNLFRDQLDRYGEVNTIALKWKEAIATLPDSTKLILNADDPQVAFLGQKVKQQVYYFGLRKTLNSQLREEHASDSLYCPNCGVKLKYSHLFYSHIGIWECPSCKLRRPDSVFDYAQFYPLTGTYNKYNTHAALLTAKLLSIPQDTSEKTLSTFKPAFGRQETISFQDKQVEIILAKNPAGFNEALRTIRELKANNLLLVLNDRIADGKDVSWIWDIDFSILNQEITNVTVSGDRAYDLGLRIKYEGYQEDLFSVDPVLSDAVKKALDKTQPGETLFILPTYTAMLEVRKIITGRKIL